MKIATHGIAKTQPHDVDDRLCAIAVETSTCFTCDCEQGRHDIGAGYAIETCNPLRLCGVSAASHEVCDRNAIESFSTKEALEVLRGPLFTILARYMRLKIDIFSTNLGAVANYRYFVSNERCSFGRGRVEACSFGRKIGIFGLLRVVVCMTSRSFA